MKIAIDFYHLRLPRRRFEISTGVRTTADIFVVNASADNIIGWGSGTPAESVSDSPMKCETALSSARELPMDIDRFFENEMTFKIRERSIAAAAALDIAMWDFRGKMDGKNLSRLLGGVPRALKTAATIDIKPLNSALEDAERLLEQGFRSLKIKVGRSVPEDLERVAAIREKVGSGIRLFVDANGGYDLENAIRFWTETFELKLDLFEQPVGADQIPSLAQLKNDSGIRVCADESAVDERSLERLIQFEAVDLINIKLMKSGGVSPAIKMIEMAKKAGIDIMIGCMGDIGLSIGAAAHLACAADPAYIDLDSHLNIEPICDGPKVRDGQIEVGDRPGIGVCLKEYWERWQVD